MIEREPLPRLGRVQPAADLADRLPIRQAVPLVLVETLGLGVISSTHGAATTAPAPTVG